MRFGMNKSGKNFASGSIKGSKQFPTGNPPPPPPLMRAEQKKEGKRQGQRRRRRECGTLFLRGRERDDS